MGITSSIRRRCALVLVLGGGCGARPDAAGEGPGAGDSSGGEVPAQVEDPPQRTPAVPTGSDDGSQDGGEAGFIRDPDGGGPTHRCDTWSQDCPVGEKCNVWADDGGGVWNASKCVPIDPDPDDIGEPCTVVDSPLSGLDSCVLGATCFYVDRTTNIGTCVEFCSGTEAAPLCSDPRTHCEGRSVTLCIPSCCPLEQDCPDGEACYPVAEHFFCAPDVSGTAGAYGDPCSFLNVCNPGLFCASADVVPGCGDEDGCCTPFCDIRSNACALLDLQLECVSWYDDIGHAVPGEEFVGGCMVPE